MPVTLEFLVGARTPMQHLRDVQQDGRSQDGHSQRPQRTNLQSACIPRKLIFRHSKQVNDCASFISQDGDDVKGKIKIEMNKGKSKLDHLGIKVELIGVIENLFDKSQTTNFINLG